MTDRSDAAPRPIRVVGIDLGTTNSTVAEVRLEPGGAAPKVRCVEVEQPTLVAPNFRRYTPERIERLLFVAITRAQSWAYMSTLPEDGQIFAPLQRLVNAKKACWTVQDERTLPRVYAGPEAPPTDDLTSLL